MRRLDMLKAKEVLRLKYDLGLSLRDIGKACRCGKSTVSEILTRAAEAGIAWPVDMNDKQLMSKLYPPAADKTLAPEPDVESIFFEMKKKSVTLMLLWEEYKSRHPDGLMYTQFCERYRRFKKNNKIFLHKEHKGGEEAETDWAGGTLSYTNPGMGEKVTAYIFVAVLPASSYPFAYAYENTKMASWIDAHVRAYTFFGGVPAITISDNTKTAVTKPDRIDPVLNRNYHEMARYYGTTLIPARAGEPTDKGAVENAVGHISRRIIAALRNRQFFSLNEINNAISEYLEILIDRPFQKMEGSRRTAFEKIDKPCLRPLPTVRYEYSDWVETRIGFNYHVEYVGFYYSTHYSYTGRKCSLRATMRIIEVYADGERIAAHPRNYNTYKRYTTLEEHMPDEHKAIFAWNPDRFLSWARKTGPETCRLIKNILESREYPVQSYRTCMGILRLCENNPASIAETASREACEKSTFSYKYFNMILKRLTVYPSKMEDKIIFHENIRGVSAYTGGGINA